MPVLLAGQSIDDFIQRAIATASNHELTSLYGGALGHSSGVARRGRFLQVSLNPAVR